MDEPTTGLDEASYRALWKHLLDANERYGTTIVVSTHRSDEAARCDRLCVMDAGRVVQTSTPDELCASLSDDLVVLSMKDPSRSAGRLMGSLDGDVRVVGEELHVGCRDAHALVPRIFELLTPGDVDAVSIRKPGLADAFLAMTGHALDGSDKESKHEH